MITEEWLNNYYNQLRRSPTTPSKEESAIPQLATTSVDPSQSGKYKNQKTEIDGILFDSAWEAAVYQRICLMKAAGIVHDFQRQVRYEILSTPKPRYLVVDFEIIRKDGAVAVVDPKGMETPVFRLKLDLFKNRYPGIPFFRWKKNGKGEQEFMRWLEEGSWLNTEQVISGKAAQTPS